MQILKMIAQVAALACRAPGLLIRYYYLRRIGARTFQRELQEAGIPSEWADELTACYKTMYIPKLFRGSRD